MRSQGPDKLKNGFACYLHDQGVRSFSEYNTTAIGSGTHKILMDYDCCCNPCLYETADFREGSPHGDFRGESADTGHCCKCNPKIVVAKWTPDNPADGCDAHEQKEPLFFEQYDADGKLSVRYVGTIINHPVAVYLSPFAVNSDGSVNVDGSGCRWTIHVASGTTMAGGAFSDQRFIDHNDVTCLGVPDFSISGVYGFGGSGGSVSLEDYDSSKVAFSKRYFGNAPITTQSNSGQIPFTTAVPNYNGIIGTQIFDPPSTGNLIQLPSGIISPPLMDSGFPGNPVGQYPTGVIPLSSDCQYVPRFLCVKFDRIDSGNEPVEDALRYREYAYDTGFYPIQKAEFHPAYTGYEHIATGQVLAKWTYTPLNWSGVGQLPAGEGKRHLFLYETYAHEIARFSGVMDLVATSGQPRYVFVPVDSGDTAPTPRDHVWRDGAFYASPVINWQSHSGAPSFINQNEDYYYQYGTDSSRTLFTGGNLTTGSIVHGDGSGCPCDVKALGYFSQGSDYTDYRFIRPGRCSCWQYLCSDNCRCVPKKLCLSAIETIRNSGTTFNNATLTWDGSSCWTAGSGDSQINLCLDSATSIGYAGEETYNGICRATLSGEYFESGHQYSFDPISPIACDFVNMSYNFTDTIVENGTGIASMTAVIVPTFSDCTSRVRCDLASPCYLDCGSHPEKINLSFRAYSDPTYDEISGPFTPTGVFTTSISLKYKEELILSGDNPLEYYSLCYYEGYTVCGTGMARVVVHMNGGGAYPLVRWGNLTSSDSNLLPPYSKEGFEGDAGESYTESCDPYYFSGVISSQGANVCPFWLCGESCGDGAMRMSMVIVEE